MSSVTTIVDTARVHAARAWLGSLALTDLVRVLPEPSVPSWVVAAVSIGAGAVPGIATPITICLFASSLYVFAPRFYPDRMGLPDTAPGFRLLVTGFALAVGVILIAGDGVADLKWAIGVGAIAVLGNVVAMLAYLRFAQGWELLDATHPPVQPLAGLAREDYASIEAEISDDLNREGIVGALGALFWLLALGLVISIPATVAGIVATVLYNAFPLPELLVLGWVVVGFARTVIPDTRAPTLAPPDLEAQLYGMVKHASRSMKGTFLTMFSVCGLFISAGYILVGVQLLTSLPTPQMLVAAPVLAAALVATGSTPLVVGIVLIWCWVRQVRRLAPFLDRWVGDTAPTTAPARPPGLTTLPTAVVLSVVTLLGGLDSNLSVAPALVAVALVGSGGLLALIVRTRRSPDTRLGREGLAVTGGLVIQYVGLALLGSANQLWPALVNRHFPPVLFAPQTLVVVALIVSLAGWPDVDRYRAQTDGWGRYLHAVYIFGFGLGAGVFGVLLSSGPGIMLLAIAVVTCLGGTALAVTTYYEL